MGYLYGYNDEFYCAKQTAYDAIRNTEGAASLAAADACRHTSLTITPRRARLAPTDKESGQGRVYRDLTRPGRMSATASVSMPLFSGSAAGTAPDCAPILESAFGQMTTAANKVSFARLASAMVALELWGFNAAALRAACAYGSIVNSLRIAGGGDSATLSADFISRYAITQDRFANASAAEKGGLTAWPAKPANPVYTGSELTGFTGVFALDAVEYDVRTFEIVMNMNRAYNVEHFNNDGSEYFGIDPYELIPEILLNFSLWSTDSADLSALLAKIGNRTSVDGSISLGTTAGGIYTFALNNLILPEGENADGYTPGDGGGDDGRKTLDISGLRAQASSAAVTDEIGLEIT